jgi:hypothetical protein
MQTKDTENVFESSDSTFDMQIEDINANMKVVTAVSMKMAVFCVIAPRRLKRLLTHTSLRGATTQKTAIFIPNMETEGINTHLKTAAIFLRIHHQVVLHKSTNTIMCIT